MILVGNKCEDTGRRVVSKEEGAKKAKDIGIPWFETSAKTGEGVKDMIANIVDLLMKADSNNQSNVPH